jgi:nitrate/TMAO reductase-like tetraheme cytochrome c subunit
MVGFVKRFWRWFTRPSVMVGQGVLVFGGLIGGAVALGGFSTAMEASNRTEFCISCHSMRDTVYEEWKASIHYRNASGIRAECADCHVPHDWGPKLTRKAMAANDVWHTILGSIDTKEKFDAKRLELAQHVWDYMKASDSRECRSCHSFEAMDFEAQRQRSREKMEPVAHGTDLSGGSTCIDCHKGVAHKLPKVERDD